MNGDADNRHVLVRRAHHRRPASGLAIVRWSLIGGVFIISVACGSSATSTPNPSAPLPSTTATHNAPHTTPATNHAASSPHVEVNPPGDIPDNQAFVAYRPAAPATGAGWTVSVPEGWARSTTGPSVVRFSDKYNSITITTLIAANAPTRASARAVELPRIRAAAKGFSSGAISEVRRTSGKALLITYRALSDINPVTGRVAREAVERYEFWRAGHEVAITLAAPVGSDNVDPWRKVTDSFTWTGK